MVMDMSFPNQMGWTQTPIPYSVENWKSCRVRAFNDVGKSSWKTAKIKK